MTSTAETTMEMRSFHRDVPDATATPDAIEPRPRRRARATYRRRKDDPRFGWESLTTAERRVAEAVAEGLTNAEAARRLFVSPYTVDYHLRQIFLKLGINSRVQLAAYLTRRTFSGSRVRPE